MIRAHRHALIALAGLALAGCGDSSMQETNAQQEEQLNAIAANTSESAGNDMAQNANASSDGGQAFRARQSTRPRKY